MPAPPLNAQETVLVSVVEARLKLTLFWHWLSWMGQRRFSPMLDNLLDHIPDGVFTVDADWRVTFFNHAAEQITGIKRADALGR
jgi:PAS domain-containing protein